MLRYGITCSEYNDDDDDGVDDDDYGENNNNNNSQHLTSKIYQLTAQLVYVRIPLN